MFCLYMSAVTVYLNVVNESGGLCPLQHNQATSKYLLHFFFISVSICYSVAHYCVHSAWHGPGLAYRRARQPERQSARHIPGAPELDASSSSQIQSHTKLCMNKYSSTPERSVNLSVLFLSFFFFRSVQVTVHKYVFFLGPIYVLCVCCFSWTRSCIRWFFE